MLKEFKYSVWYLGGKLFLIYIFSIIINLIVITGFLNISEKIVWNWVLTAMALIIHAALIYLFISIDGRKDIHIDGANEKRRLRNPEFEFIKKFDAKKGFLAGLIAQSPIIICYIAWLIIQTSTNDFMFLEFIIRLAFSQYLQFLTLWGIKPLAVIGYISLFIAASGMSYYSAKAHRRKILTIIKRNSEKALKKGIVKK